MKKCVLIMLFLGIGFYSSAQSFEAQQLLLNWEKLTQFKKILQDMYNGYKILDKGYTAIKNISKGSFSLHKDFLDALLQVSPAVKRYGRVADIINYQVRLVKDYKAAFAEFKQAGAISPEEIGYLGKVYGSLLRESAEGIEELAMVLTAGKLRMSDNERLEAIDRIYTAVLDRASFLKSFNNQTALLSLKRKNEQAEIKMSKKTRD